MYIQKDLTKQGLNRECFEAIACVGMAMLEYEYVHYYIPFLEMIRRLPVVRCGSIVEAITPGKLLDFEDVTGCDLKLNPQKNSYDIRQLHLRERALEKLVCRDEYEIMAHCAYESVSHFVNLIMTEIGTAFMHDLYFAIRDAINKQNVLVKTIGGDAKDMDFVTPANDNVQSINITDPKLAGFNLLTKVLKMMSVIKRPAVIIGIVPMEIMQLLQAEDRFIACCSQANTKTTGTFMTANILGTTFHLAPEPFPDYLEVTGNDVTGFFFDPARLGFAYSNTPKDFMHLNKSANILHPAPLSQEYNSINQPIVTNRNYMDYIGTRAIVGSEADLSALRIQVMYKIGFGRIAPYAAVNVTFKGTGVLDQVTTNTATTYITSV